MARKRTLNYRELRTDFDEAERRRGDEEELEDEDEGDDEDEEEESSEDEEEEGDEDEEEVEAPKKKKPAKKPAKPRRTRASKVVRMRVVWKVFNNSNQPVATYKFNQKDEAEGHAAKLATDKKQTFFVQPVKEPIEE